MKKPGLAHLLLLLVAVIGNLAGCKNKNSESKQPEIAVTNSYLQCIVEDLCEGQTDILCLTPSGMCPGHFDISPAQVNQLCTCRVLLLFDFQKKIEDSLLRLKEKGLQTGLVRSSAGLCVPATYLAACRDVCNILSLEHPVKKAAYNERIKLAEERLENLSNELRRKVNQAGLESAKVLVSNRQAQFCNWLGLETIGTFVGSDMETVANINQCLEKARTDTVRFVIANKQEGTALGEALAERLGAKVVVFSNFPDVDSRPNRCCGFDRLLEENVQALLGALSSAN
jgi:zinc/manganese transport system substrate-binding protein